MPKRRFVVLAIGCAILAICGIAFYNTLFHTRSADARPVPPGTGLDPLSSSEQSKASVLAKSGLPESLVAPARTDVLYSQVHEADKGTDLLRSARRADVYLYDYSRDRALHRVVNLDSGKVESTGVVSGQPSATAAEARRAAELVLSNDRLGPLLREDFRRTTSKQLTSARQLRTQALIFRAPQAAGAKNASDVAACGKHRCVFVFMQLPSSEWVDTTRLVADLSAGRVHVLSW
ncbi:hypothetical protein [Flindersiella endophytica]